MSLMSMFYFSHVKDSRSDVYLPQLYVGDDDGSFYRRERTLQRRSIKRGRARAQARARTRIGREQGTRRQEEKSIALFQEQRIDEAFQ